MSAVYDVMPRPDWATTTTVAVPSGAARDARAWARAITDPRNAPLWIKALFAMRELAVRALRIPPGEPSMLAATAVRQDEAIVDTDDVHLHFVAGVRTDHDLLHVTTAVTFKGLRGRVYFVPVRFLHDQITRSMMSRAARRD